MACSKDVTKEEKERLRGHGDKIKLIDFKVERRLLAGS